MKPDRILICGGRDFSAWQKGHQILDELKKWFEDEFVVIQGGAKGADAMAAAWASKHGFPMIEMKPAWDALGHKAGPIRNEWMLKWALPNLIIAFPGGVGTKHMISLARNRIPTHVVKL